MEFKKIRDAVWEYPKEGDMNVPLRVFASDKLIEKMKKDRTLEQARNVASLPGIVKYSMVMPDGHEGYGFPIGGVAAFDLEKGVISPGGVGFDINCLCENTKILNEFGAHVLVQEFEEEFNEPLIESNGMFLFQGRGARLVSVSKGAFETGNATHFMYKEHKGEIIRIESTAGTVKCTPDHPIYTLEGKRNAAEIKKGEYVLAKPFEGVKYEPIEDAEKKAILAKLIGYLIGDGTLYFSKGKGYVAAYGTKRDLEKMASDIERLGFSPRIYSRTRHNTTKNFYGENSFETTAFELHVKSKKFAELLVSLGMPEGKKASANFSVPEWIMNSPLWIQRLFLAGFFGAEMSSPKTLSKTCFYCPTICQNKNINNETSGREFFAQITKMLENFGVRVNKISTVEKYHNKQGKTVRLRLLLSSDSENLIKLYSKIGFEYNAKRQMLGEVAVLYIREKEKLHQYRREVAKKVREYKNKGFKLREIQKLFCSELCNCRFIERQYYSKSAKERITLSFPSFKEYYKKQEAIFKKHGAFAAQVFSVAKFPYNGRVYDFTVDKYHNFVAEGTVVSNCGVRLVRTNLEEDEVKKKIRELTNELFKQVPCGLGSKSNIRLSESELDEAISTGVKWAIEQGYATKEDAEHLEENGSMEGADPAKISAKAKKRGKPQFGTLGSGNHFLEVQRIDRIYYPEAAKAFGITDEGQVVVMIHTGSRGFGHQVCSDYLETMVHAAQKYGIKLKDKELAAVPFHSKEAQDYLAAMKAAVNYAFNNRQVITYGVRKAFEKVFRREWEEMEMKLVYGVAHNIAKVEEHEVDGEKRKLCVHRKGATRAFWKGRKEIPAAYRDIGQPVLIPGSMNTASYILVGEEGAKETFGSTCHGAGREMSRHQALRQFRGDEIERQMLKQGMGVRAASKKVLAEEAGGAYKDIDEVVASVERAGISKIVARMTPLGVVKG